MAQKRSLIINGDMDVWQRGTSFAAAASGQYGPDRFQYRRGDTVARHTIERSTDVPTFAQARRVLNYSMKVDCTTIDDTPAGNDNVNLQYRMEGYDWKLAAQRDCVGAFWVKSPKAGIHCLSAQNAVDRTLVREYNVLAANTWERKLIALPASPAAGTWNYTTGIGLVLIWALMAGSGAQGEGDAWVAGTHLATENQVNCCDNAANDFYITGVEFYPGLMPQQRTPINIAEEFARCRRYYQARDLFVPTAAGNKAYVPINMRAAPTIAGGGTGFASTGTTADTLVCEQTTGAAQSLTLSSEL